MEKSSESIRHQLERQFVIDYLGGSNVEKLIYSHPFREAEGYRLLDRWGVIKSAGRSHSPFGKALYFLTKMVLTKLPLELLYYRHMPASFRETISKSTLHRIARHARQGLTRTRGTALLISPEGDPTSLLVADDMTIPNPSVGKYYGALSYPMTYSVDGESPTTSIRRVLQQEVLTDLVLHRRFDLDSLAADPTPVGHMLVGDVDVAIHHLTLPWETLDHLSSFKLKNFRFLNISDMAALPPLDTTVRAGIPEIASAYSSFLHLHNPSLTYVSQLNQQLALLASK